LGQKELSLEEKEVTQTAVPQESVSEPNAEAISCSDHTSVASGDEKSQSRWYVVRELVETVLLTIVIFAIVNTFTGRFRIEGPSMMPNLHEGQYLIINKVLYKLQEPRRGDIIVFHHPRNTGRDLIKRIIGLPGETVEVKQGEIYIDGRHLDEPYISNKAQYSVTFELGAGEFFVLGDNRPNSDDSHNWGVLEKGNIVGKAWISYWPPDTWGGLPHYSYSNDSITQDVETRIAHREGAD
jgi:signal peptidase I